MDSPNLIAWKLLRGSYIDAGVPIEQPILEAPELTLVFFPNPGRLGMRLRLDEGRTWSTVTKLRNVTVRRVLLSGSGYVEVLTQLPELFRPIYALIGDVLSRMADGETDCLQALELSLADFDALVARTLQLSREKAIGLFGELSVLHSLLREGIAGIDCWIGAHGETHDIRVNRIELEVKTTTTNVREHVIHGLNQLSPTPGHALALVSIRLGSPGDGNGKTLNDLVFDIKALIKTDNAAVQKFSKALQLVGYEAEDAECLVPYQLTAPIMRIEIGTDFPIVNHELISNTLGIEHSSRLSDVSLTLNLENLGRLFNPSNCSA